SMKSRPRGSTGRSLGASAMARFKTSAAISLGFCPPTAFNKRFPYGKRAIRDFIREEFEKMASAGKLERQHIEALVQLTNSGFCMHRSWGFGRIKTVDTVFARFTIDFPNKPGHTMDLAFAAESLRPISKEHILARKAADLENLRQMAATNHLELVKLVLNSFAGKATVEQIQEVLVPDVIRDDWKKWWEAAKRE